MVRLALLLLLAEEPRNGYQLMQEIEERSGGRWRPSRCSSRVVIGTLGITSEYWPASGGRKPPDVSRNQGAYAPRSPKM